MAIPVQHVLKTFLTADLECNDNVLGPISNCRFDFTLLFEQCILSAVPSSILLLLGCFRILSLYPKDQKTYRSTVKFIKLILTSIFFLLQLALVVSWSIFSGRTNASIPVTILNLMVSSLICGLSHLEHSRSVRPSSLLNGYLLLSMLLDCAQSRTLFKIGQNFHIAALFAASWGVKLVMLVVESMKKTSYLKSEYQSLPPESTSGIINRSLLWWLNDLFKIGYRGIITENDLFELDPNLKAEHVGSKLQEAWDRQHREGRFTLIFAVGKALGRDFGSGILPRLCLIGFTFSQPFLISRLLSLLEEPDDETSRIRGYGLVAATALIYIGIAVSSLLSNHNLFRFITMFRGGMVSLIYDRTLILMEGGDSAVSLMSNDVDQIAFCLEELNEFWSRLVEIAIGVPLLSLQLGWVSIMPLVVVVFSSSGTSVVAKLIGDRQKLWSDATQKRITTTSSMLRDMSGLKMTGLVEAIGGLVQDERVQETKQMESWAWINVWLNVVEANIPFALAPAATFGVYAIQAAIQGSQSLNTVQAFTSLALVTLVSYPATRVLAAVPNLASSIGCFDRIQDYLLNEPREDKRLKSRSSPNIPDIEPLIDLRSDLPNPSNWMVCLNNASIRPAPEAAIILKNVSITITKGSLVMITGSVGVGKSMLLKAILGELPCEGTVSVKSKHIAFCSQTPWLQNGTIRQAICGFDDLSVDEIWYETVLEACALNYDISRLGTDQMIIGSRGTTLSGGQKHCVALARALYSRAKIFLLDDILSALDKKTEKFITDKLFGDEGIFSKLGATVVMVTHATQYLHFADQVIAISTDGKVQDCSTYKPIEVLKVTENLMSDENEKETINTDIVLEDVISDEEDLTRQSGDIEVYKYYFKSVGFFNMLVFIFFCVVYVFCNCFSGIWLKWWSDVHGGQIGLYLSVYFLLGIGYCAGNGGYSWAIQVVIGPDTGRKMHHILLQTVLKAPLSLFTESEMGSLLNRFSQDMSLIEDQLAIGVLITVSNLISCLAEASLVTTGSPFIAVAIPLFMVAVYYLQQIYLRTSRQLRFLDIETRTPVYAHFLETLEGLSTIRAFGWENKFKDVNLTRLNNSQKPYYLLFCIQRWLGLVLDLMVAAMAILVVALAISLRKYTSSGLLGISMNNVLSFNVSLTGFITGWTMLETSLGAIARLKAFEAGTKMEALEGEDCIPPENWPSSGLIEIQDLTAGYSSSPTIQNINLTIKPCQKVAICGRTGSGKSTLLSTILRILEISSGTIEIDSINLSTIPRPVIRKRLVTIPQHALSIPGTLRLNLDPFSTNSDSSIITALTKVQLWPFLSSRGGLNVDFQLDSLSKGQQQQLALARAILQKSKVVLLDEVTSSVDVDTDRILKAVMEEEWRDCTVMTVAHRKETILEADVVVVLDEGVVVEFGVPGELMGCESRLKSLLRADL